MPESIHVTMMHTKIYTIQLTNHQNDTDDQSRQLLQNSQFSINKPHSITTTHNARIFARIQIHISFPR